LLQATAIESCITATALPTGNMNYFESIFQTNGPLFTKFNQKSKEDINPQANKLKKENQK
jgi:hypothetical protein